MKQKSSYINIEDVLFSSILGAYLGTFINNLGEFHILGLVCFFVIFPILLKYIEGKTKYALVIVNAVGILLFFLFLRVLISNEIISDSENAGLLIIFIGWIISINFKSFFSFSNEQRPDNLELQMESIPIEGIKGIIFLVSDYSKRVENDETFDLNNSLIYRLMSSLENDGNNVNNIWLVHEDVAEKRGSSSHIARELKDKYKDKFEKRKVSIDNPYDTQSTFSAIRFIYSQAVNECNLKENEIICESTGGAKPM